MDVWPDLDALGSKGLIRLMVGVGVRFILRALWLEVVFGLR